MPHFTIEYSANLDGLVDMGATVELVRKAAVETGIFPLGGIRVRAIRCEHYAIADGRKTYGFLDMVLRLGEGRDLSARKKAGEHIFKALSAHLDPVFANSKFALSFDMQINDTESFRGVSRRLVDAALLETRLRPDSLFLPANRELFATTLGKQGDPVDYLLYATITSGTTDRNKTSQRDYLLTLELVNLHDGTAIKESAEIRKGYSKNVAAKWWHFGLITDR